MKKKEMVDKITIALGLTHSENRTYKDIAEIALHVAEKNGMLPPGHMKPISFIEGKQYPLVPGDFKNDEGVWCTPGVNEWEPE